MTSTTTSQTDRPEPKFGARVHVPAQYQGGAEFRGRFAGYVFGDPTSACEAYVETTHVRWPDRGETEFRRMDGTGRGKFWAVRPLTADEAADEQAVIDRVLSYVD